MAEEAQRVSADGFLSAARLVPYTPLARGVERECCRGRAEHQYQAEAIDVMQIPKLKDRDVVLLYKVRCPKGYLRLHLSATSADELRATALRCISRPAPSILETVR